MRFSFVVYPPPLVLGTADCDCTIPFSHTSLFFDRGFWVRPDKQQSVVCPLVGGLPFAMLAKSEDLTFPSPPNVFFPHFVIMNLILFAEEKMFCNALVHRSQSACVAL